MGVLGRLGAAILTLVLATATVVAITPPAAAAGGGSVVLSGNTVTFTGTSGPDTILTGSRYEPFCEGAQYCVFFMTVQGTITSWPGCRSDSPAPVFQVTCKTPGPTEVFINLGDGDDTYISDPNYPNIGSYAQVTVDGGAGNDTLRGGAPPETLSGGAGDDIIVPDQGPSTVNVGPDTLIGGSGSDTLYYDQSAAGASGAKVSLNGLADDGTTMPRDVDNVGSDFEKIYLTNGPDTVTGDARDTSFYLLGGDDTVDAGAGSDLVVGGAGNDTIDGGPGADVIWGDSDADPAVTGNDTINTVDGTADTVDCGPGTDAVTADASDQIRSGCESVTISGSGTQLSADIAVTKTRLKANKKRKKAPLALQCSGGLRCIGKVVVRTTKGKSRRIAGRKKVAVGTFSIAANRSRKVRLKLTRAARKILRKTRRANVRARLVVTTERVTTFTSLKLTR